MTITGILMSGSGIVREGGVIQATNTNLTLRNSSVTNGAASQAGGGIYTQGGTLNLNNVSGRQQPGLRAQAAALAAASPPWTLNVTIARSKI